MVTATALYAFYTPVTAVDRHEVYLRRYESPAATITITTAIPRQFLGPCLSG